MTVFLEFRLVIVSVFFSCVSLNHCLCYPISEKYSVEYFSVWFSTLPKQLNLLFCVSCFALFFLETSLLESSIFILPGRLAPFQTDSTPCHPGNSIHLSWVEPLVSWVPKLPLPWFANLVCGDIIYLSIYWLRHS